MPVTWWATTSQWAALRLLAPHGRVDDDCQGSTPSAVSPGRGQSVLLCLSSYNLQHHKLCARGRQFQHT
jgi:hypothetical protein